LVTRAPLVGVLALQGDVREHVSALVEAGAEPVAVRDPATLAQVDGLVIPGGESTAIGGLMEIFGILAPLRSRVAAGLPVFGSCAGMILLADEVLDGRPGQPLVGGLDVVVRRNAFGRQVDSFEEDLTVDGVDGEVHGVFIRAPWVESVGPRAEVLCRLPEDRALGRAAGRVVAVRQGPLLATAFHPELSGDARVHGLFVSLVRQALGSREPQEVAVP
jgi:5'-phosphate synthase pdxT subunit